jgi:hypothetical protein
VEQGGRRGVSTKFQSTCSGGLLDGTSFIKPQVVNKEQERLAFTFERGELDVPETTKRKSPEVIGN